MVLLKKRIAFAIGVNESFRGNCASRKMNVTTNEATRQAATAAASRSCLALGGSDEIRNDCAPVSSPRIVPPRPTWVRTSTSVVYPGIMTRCAEGVQGCASPSPEPSSDAKKARPLRTGLLSSEIERRLVQRD